MEAFRIGWIDFEYGAALETQKSSREMGTFICCWIYGRLEQPRWGASTRRDFSFPQKRVLFLGHGAREKKTHIQTERCIIKGGRAS